MRINLTILCITFSCAPAFAQFFEYGQDPASIRWKKADTENFRLIFPAGYEEKVPELLWLLEDSYTLNAGDIGHKMRKTEVVLHNHSVVSNGFVALAPRRMELFPYPDPNAYPGDRMRQLTLHEMRHVAQVDKINQGTARFLSLLIGEQGHALATSALPFWLLEGDAIMAETGFTQTGRGRLPSFEKEIKAILLNDQRYSYDKSYFGSYRDFIPDYYRYGFQMVAYAHDKYGEGFWPDAIEYTGRKLWRFSPLTKFIKQETGLSRSDFYGEAMEQAKSHWQKSAENREIHSYLAMAEIQSAYTSYTYPHWMKDSSLIAIKTGLDIIPAFVRIRPEGREEVLFNPGYLQSGRINVSGNRILWDEYVSDPRWGNRSYSVLKVLNYETMIIETLTKNSRFSSPAFSTFGDTIAAIESDLLQRINLVFLSSIDGQTFSRVASPDNAWLQSPAWVKGTSKIAAIATDEEGKRIVLYDTKTNAWEEIFNSGFYDIHDLSTNGEYLIFRGSFSGTDDIYALNYLSGELYRTTYSRYGAYYPTVTEDGRSMVFSEYTGTGYRPVNLSLGEYPGRLVEAGSFSVGEQPYFQANFQPGDSLEKLKVPDGFAPEVKKYSKAANLFRFHSWLPFYFNYNEISLENPEIAPGFSITSQNTLSTAFTSLGYEYNAWGHFFHSSFTYKGLYPVFSLSTEYGGTASIFRGRNDPELSNPGAYQSYNFLSYIPLNFSAGKIIRGVQPILKVNYSGNYFYSQNDGGFRKGMISMEPRLYMYSYLRRAYRDLQPNAGLLLDARSLSAPFETEQLGSISSLRVQAFLPGLARNHGIKLQAWVQKQKPEKYLYNNQVSFIRGFDDLTSIGLQKYSADYVLPLFYPDFQIGSLIYLKRIHAGLFYDYMNGKDVYEMVNNERVVSDKSLRSFGAELYFEYHLLRFFFPFVQGVRIVYLPEEKGYKYEGVFRIDLGRI